MIKKFYQTLIPILTLKILIFTLKFSCKVLQNLEFKIENSEKIKGKNILLDSLIELLSHLKQSLTINESQGKQAKLTNKQPKEDKQIIQK